MIEYLDFVHAAAAEAGFDLQEVLLVRGTCATAFSKEASRISSSDERREDVRNAKPSKSRGRIDES